MRCVVTKTSEEISEEHSNVSDGGRPMHVAWSRLSWGSSFSTFVVIICRGQFYPRSY